MYTIIVILETKGPEYRVFYIDDFSDIFGNYNDVIQDYKPNWDKIKSLPLLFMSTSITEAEKAAIDESEKHAYLDDGICHVSNFKHLQFPS